MDDEITECPYCQCSLKSSRLRGHVKRRCPSSPDVIKKLSKEKPDFCSTELKPKILIRSRLERLFRDVSSKSVNADEPELVEVFKAFYTMYVWRGPSGRKDLKPLNVDGEKTVSVHAVSGGLPSLGKKAK